MEIYKPKDFAERLGVSVATLQRWDREGVLKAYRSPTDRRYYTSEQVEEYFNKNHISHTGHWMDVYVDGEFKVKCSVCDAIRSLDDNFCGNCGAKMSKGDDNKCKKDIT
jgi:hypothetical protein